MTDEQRAMLKALPNDLRETLNNNLWTYKDSVKNQNCIYASVSLFLTEELRALNDAISEMEELLRKKR